jgi:hypothetical protein
MELESAIPESLRQERTLPAKTPANYQPPFPAYSARFPHSVKNLVIAILGAQHQTPPPTPSPSLSHLLAFLTKSPADSQPTHYDLASTTDNRNFHNEAIIAYWPSTALYDQWAVQSGFDAWWTGIEPASEPHGWFREVFSPPLERLETVFSDDVMPEGAAYLREGVSGPVREHVYLGSMRDRLPVGQRDGLSGEGMSGGEKKGGEVVKERIRVPGRQNLTIIRSGQDWSNTNPHERELYLETMHPVLIKGMTFLRDSGSDVGCYSCRFMDVLDSKSMQPGTEKTFGLAYFDDLGSLEGWSKDHQTHLDIFGRFLNYAKELQNEVSLRLFHEVLVLASEQQSFEYIGCHDGTGMLASL